MKPKWINLPARNALVAWRTSKQLEAQDVAKQLGLAAETYSRIEAGIRRMPEDKRALCEKITSKTVTVAMWTKS